MAAAFAIGPISGCSLNPALTFGVMIAHLFHTGKIQFSILLAYTIAALLGALLASLVFNVVRSAEYEVRSSVFDKDLEYIAESIEPQKLPEIEPQRFTQTDPWPQMQNSQYTRKDPRTGNVMLLH